MNDHLHRELALVRAEEARRQAMGDGAPPPCGTRFETLPALGRA